MVGAEAWAVPALTEATLGRWAMATTAATVAEAAAVVPLNAAASVAHPRTPRPSFV